MFKKEGGVKKSSNIIVCKNELGFDISKMVKLNCKSSIFNSRGASDTADTVDTVDTVENKTFFSVSEVAAKLSVSNQMIYRLIKKGDLIAYVFDKTKKRKTYRVKKEDLSQFISCSKSKILDNNLALSENDYLDNHKPEIVKPYFENLLRGKNKEVL